MLPLLSLRVISVLLLPFSTVTPSAAQELESDESTAIGTPLPTVPPNLPDDEYDFYHPHPAVHNDHYRKRSSGPWTLGVYICHDHGYSGKCETMKFTGKDDQSDDNPMRVLKGDINSIGPDVGLVCKLTLKGCIPGTKKDCDLNNIEYPGLARVRKPFNTESDTLTCNIILAGGLPPGGSGHFPNADLGKKHGKRGKETHDVDNPEEGQEHEDEAPIAKRIVMHTYQKAYTGPSTATYADPTHTETPEDEHKHERRREDEEDDKEKAAEQEEEENDGSVAKRIVMHSYRKHWTPSTTKSLPREAYPTRFGG